MGMLVNISMRLEFLHERISGELVDTFYGFSEVHFKDRVEKELGLGVGNEGAE